MFDRTADPIYATIPVDILEALIDYGQNHDYVSGAIYHCLANDFVSVACSGIRSDALAGIARFIFNELPHDCWGSPEIVDAWLAGTTAIALRSKIGRRARRSRA